MNANISAEQVFRELADVLVYSGNNDFYLALIQALERLLQVDHVVLAQISPGGYEARTLAVTSHGKTISNFNYPLHGTPCENVVGEGFCLFNGGVVEQFPKDDLLKELKVESYLGMPILTSDGTAIGILSILQDSKMTWPELGREVIRIAVSQIGAEMERKNNEKRIEQLAYQDPLTQLPNRTALQERINQAVSASYRTQTGVGVCIIDLRRFKEINDMHGHEAGDLLLKAVSARLANLLGDQLFLARQSSDEFTVVSTNTDTNGLAQLVHRIHECFVDPFGIGRRRFQVEVNIGAALFPHDSDTASELFQHASIALDEAKLSGLKECIYNASMAEKLNRAHAIHARLIEAIRGGTLSLAFQPQFDTRTGRLHGAEALCRWQDEELGFVSPAEFIPIAEERGLIRELDALVVQKAVQQLEDWQQRGLSFPGRISVNLSAHHFEGIDLVAELERYTKSVGPAVFTLELTESAMMRNPEQALYLTDRLREKGFDIALDDFGTGYSSFAYLQRLDLQTLKIDRSFITDIVDNEQNQPIVSAIIAMAKSMGMAVVAEGVETQEQTETLQTLGCQFVQGFYFGKPVSGAEFERLWLTEKASEQGVLL